MHPNDGATMQQALAALRAGQPAVAGQWLAKLSPAGQQHPDGLYLAALASDQLGRADAAEQCFRAAIQGAPRNAYYLNSFALFLARQGQEAEAVEHLRRAVAVAPSHAEAWYNLALLEQDRDALAAAGDALDRARALEGDSPRILSAAGALAQARGDAPAARQLLTRARDAAPQDRGAWRRLARALGQQGDHAAALAVLDAGPDDEPELAAERGDLLVEMGRLEEAQAVYSRVATRWPQHHQVLTAMTFLTMQADRNASPRAALAPFARALAAGAGADVWQAAITAASGLGDGEQVLAWAEAAEAATGLQPAWRLSRLTGLRQLGEFAACLDEARAEQARFPDEPGFASHRAWAALRLGAVDEAEAAAGHYAQARPLEQTGWAMLGTAWRLKNDPREHQLLDYERMVIASDLVTPKGWPSTAAFLADLKSVLEARHVMQNQPAEQTLRGGTQTPGDLFATTDPVLVAFRSALKATVEAAIAGLKPQPGHPFLGRLTGRVKMQGAWSVRLKGQGFHVNHIHPRGWLSSAFYVSLPPEIGLVGDEGKLVFGVPDAKLGLDLPPRRVITPAPGRLAIFPSYAWHGTVPFQSNEARLTAAFDALPV
jgi:tetratricopeptide (TPR) repeat protein